MLGFGEEDPDIRNLANIDDVLARSSIAVGFGFLDFIDGWLS